MAERPRPSTPLAGRRPVETPVGPDGGFHTMDELADAVARRVALGLADDLADAVAERLLARLGDTGAGGLAGIACPASVPLTAREVMARLGRSYDFVRDHRRELGVLPVAGDRPRLLFDAEAVDRFARDVGATTKRRSASTAETPVATGKARRRRRPGLGTEVDLLPIRGRSEGDRAA